MKFKSGKITVVNFGEPLEDEEIETLINNYSLEDYGVEEITYTCKGFTNSKKPLYLQCVDWIKLIPNKVIKNEGFVLKLPENLPCSVSIYMIMECFSRTGKHPKILEYKGNEMNRIVDLEYESNFSKMKRIQDEDSSFNSNQY